jgi:hypothetical protein
MILTGVINPKTLYVYRLLKFHSIKGHRFD